MVQIVRTQYIKISITKNKRWVKVKIVYKAREKSINNKSSDIVMFSWVAVKLICKGNFINLNVYINKTEEEKRNRVMCPR